MEMLRHVLKQDDTVLFIGSGISLWSGLPSWSRLIEELAVFVESTGSNAKLIRAEADAGDLLQAASYGFDALTKSQIGDFIRAACRYGTARPHEIHRKIVSLGPRCFVTTNYDNLLEESLRLWQPDRFFRPPITNRHLTETAEIVHARAIDFIFKPHGDAADTDSIILTREQYRQLLPQGERHNALESVKMLLASRPVVYLGFGLRDPDFTYVRDLLANTYKGGTRDHYAIMADVSEVERHYWRRNYGIHLIGYVTSERPDKSRDHSALLALLEDLLVHSATPAPPTMVATSNSDTVLSLARHAARLSRIARIDPEFEIRVHLQADTQRESRVAHRPDKFSHFSVDRFLDEGPVRSILIGLPGAGKTYSLRRAAARLAEKLHAASLADQFNEASIIVPVLADLKLYRGSLEELVSETLPKALPLAELMHRYDVKIFLDSFNEMPREYWESGSYESDFAKFIAQIGTSSLVIGSRTTDGLSKFGLPAYALEQIKEADIAAELKRLGVEFGGRFASEVKSLLQKPFYFQLWATGRVCLPMDAHPRDFYYSLFGNLRRAFEERFGGSMDLEKTLSVAAYDAINRGEEAYPLSDLLRILKTAAEEARLSDVTPRDIANWLVSTSILIPYTGARIAFVHQSITEYLAANELAKRYEATPHILKEKLALTRWDQALFLALSLLPASLSEAFLQDVVDADFALALNAVKYLEDQRDEIVSKLLVKVPERYREEGISDWGITWALQSSVPIADVHEPQLRMLVNLRGPVGAAAVHRLAELKGVSVKEEMLQMLKTSRNDYNFCVNGLGPALKRFASDEDVRIISAFADSIEQERKVEVDDDDISGFAGAAAEFLSEIDLTVVNRELLLDVDSAELHKLRVKILCGVLKKHHTTVALELAGDLLLRDVADAVFTTYFIAKHAENASDIDWSSFTAEHVRRLESRVYDPGEHWAIPALTCVCAARVDLAELVKTTASSKPSLVKAALLHCASPSEQGPVFEAFSELLSKNSEQREPEPMHLIKKIEIDWAGRESLFVELLRLRDTQLADALLGDVSPFSNRSLGRLQIGSIYWWLEWMSELSITREHYWFQERLGSLLAEYVDDEARDALVAEFNTPNSRFRRLLLMFVFPHQKDLSTDDFSDDAISFVLADIAREGSYSRFLHGHVLGNAATEQFVVERLLPLVPEATPPLSKNLHKVLQDAGTRHGRRYVPQ